MHTRVRTTLQTMKAPIRLEKKEKMEKHQRNGLMDVKTATAKQRQPSGQRKMALLQDVNKLKKELRHEESVHKALERAFTRPLGALPRLPPYLPQHTLELLAELAVLEEEIVRLEVQVVNFRQGLYQEAVNISSSRKNMEKSTNLIVRYPCRYPKSEQSKSSLEAEEFSATSIASVLLASPENPSCLKQFNSDSISDRAGASSNKPMNGSKIPHFNSSFSEDCEAKEKEFCINSPKNKHQSLKQSSSRIRTPVKKTSMEHRSIEKHYDTQKLQLECKLVDRDRAEQISRAIPIERASEGESSSPNKISEDILKCLSTIFLRMSIQKNRGKRSNMFSSLTRSALHENCEETEYQDPYGVCEEFGNRDIGAYKHLFAVEASSIDPSPRANTFFLIRRLKLLLGKLSLVDLHCLAHQQKLAFWINIYNSCMMNAFLEHGIPESPQMIIALMEKAMINVGGHSLNAMTIEHFILRLPYHLKYTYSRGAKNDQMAARNIFGLERSEPLVTFALSCGSWSSPAVRVYTASEVEIELEVAKRDYLQAAVSIATTNMLAIPKLLDWYLLDFAKDLESLLDWVCLQLPIELQKEAIKCIERGKREPPAQLVQVMPYEFSFRYLLHR